MRRQPVDEASQQPAEPGGVFHAEHTGERGDVALMQRVHFRFQIASALREPHPRRTAILRALFAQGDKRRRLNLLPWAALVVDYLENLATATVIARYPDTTDVVAALAPIFSATKWILTIGSFVVLIALAIDLGIKKVRRLA